MLVYKKGKNDKLCFGGSEQFQGDWGISFSPISSISGHMPDQSQQSKGWD
jgi:hypothetical protein